MVEEQKIKNLEVGMTFKRRELCDFIGDTYREGTNCQKSQDKEWKR